MAEDWMIHEVSGVKGVLHVVLSTADGLAKAWTPQTDKVTAEQTAAACAGLYSIGQGLKETFETDFGSGSGDTRQVMIDLGGGFLFVRRASDGSRLAAVTDTTADPGVLGEQMAKTVAKTASHLAAEPRHADTSAAT